MAKDLIKEAVEIRAKKGLELLGEVFDNSNKKTEEPNLELSNILKDFLKEIANYSYKIYDGLPQNFDLTKEYLTEAMNNKIEIGKDFEPCLGVMCLAALATSQDEKENTIIADFLKILEDNNYKEIYPFFEFITVKKQDDLINQWLSIRAIFISLYSFAYYKKNNDLNKKAKETIKRCIKNIEKIRNTLEEIGQYEGMNLEEEICRLETALNQSPKREGREVFLNIYHNLCDLGNAQEFSRHAANELISDFVGRDFVGADRNFISNAKERLKLDYKKLLLNIIEKK